MIFEAVEALEHLKRLPNTECMRLELSRAAGSAPAPSRATCHYGHETDARHRVWTTDFEHERDHGYARLRRGAFRVLLEFHAQVGRTHEAGEAAPRVLAIGGQAPSQGAVFSLQHHFHPSVLQQDEDDPNATCSTTIQALDLYDKCFGTYRGWAWNFLELLGAGSRGSEPQAGCLCTSFSSTIHHVGSVYFSRFPNCKAFHASAL